MAGRMGGLWLPEGLHYGLHVEHHPLEAAGPFIGGGNKMLWHTTESPWDSVDSMVAVLAAKRAAPHFVIGGRPRTRRPVVVQLVPLNHGGRSLQNDSSDGFATNMADCFQVEICWRAALAGLLTDWHYKAFANLTRLMNVVLPDELEVPPKLVRRFRSDKRLSDRQFVDAVGHLGHRHAPDNIHWDPGPDFKGSRLIRLLTTMPRGGYDL